MGKHSSKSPKVDDRDPYGLNQPPRRRTPSTLEELKKQPGFQPATNPATTPRSGIDLHPSTGKRQRGNNDEPNTARKRHISSSPAVRAATGHGFGGHTSAGTKDTHSKLHAHIGGVASSANTLSSLGNIPDKEDSRSVRSLAPSTQGTDVPFHDAMSDVEEYKDALDEPTMLPSSSSKHSAENTPKRTISNGALAPIMRPSERRKAEQKYKKGLEVRLFSKKRVSFSPKPDRGSSPGSFASTLASSPSVRNSLASSSKDVALEPSAFYSKMDVDDGVKSPPLIGLERRKHTATSSGRLSKHRSGKGRTGSQSGDVAAASQQKAGVPTRNMNNLEESDSDMLLHEDPGSDLEEDSGSDDQEESGSDEQRDSVSDGEASSSGSGESGSGSEDSGSEAETVKAAKVRPAKHPNTSSQGGKVVAAQQPATVESASDDGHEDSALGDEQGSGSGSEDSRSGSEEAPNLQIDKELKAQSGKGRRTRSQARAAVPAPDVAPPDVAAPDATAPAPQETPASLALTDEQNANLTTHGPRKALNIIAHRTNSSDKVELSVQWDTDTRAGKGPVWVVEEDVHAEDKEALNKYWRSSHRKGRIHFRPYEVYRIKDHDWIRGRSHHKTLHLEIEWTGYTGTSWEPWRQFQEDQPKMVRDYFASIGGRPKAP